MSVHELTDADARDLLTENPLAIVTFHAPWCPACREFAPIFARVAGRHPDIAFGRVDSSAQPELKAAFGVSNVPFLAVVRDRGLVFSKVGALTEDALESVIRQVRTEGADEAPAG